MCDCSYHCEARRQGESLKHQANRALSLANTTEGRSMKNASHPCLKKFENINSSSTRAKGTKDTCNRIEENNPIYRGYLHTTLNEGCGVTKDQLYLKMYQDLRRRGRLLHACRMSQGPDDAFLDYFPPGFVPGKSKPIVVLDTQHACLRPVSPEQFDEKWKKKAQELHNHELKLYDNQMIMGPHEYFPEFFPPNYDHEAKKQFPKLIPTCRGQCGGDLVPGPFFLTPKCRFLTHIPLSYVPQYKKQHHVWPTYCFNQSLRR